jgi:pimeloyl-ACP methyl ester carboxylesterase
MRIGPSPLRAFRWPRVATALLAVFALVGCRGAYRSLPSERQIPALAARLDAAAALPSRRVMVTVASASGEPVRMAVTEVGSGTRSRVVVLVHGVLSDSATWRFMTADLAKDADVLLLDLPGCGESDKPEPVAFGPGSYGPTALARYVRIAVADRIASHPSWAHVTIVGHSLGSAVLLRLLGAPELASVAPRALERVDAAVLLSALDFAIGKQDATFEKIVHLSPLETRLGYATGVLQSKSSESVLACGYGAGAAPREEADRTVCVLANPATLRAGQAMIRDAVPFCADDCPDWPAVEALVADYARVTVPCLLIHGERDSTLPAALAYKLRDQLPRAWLRLLPGATHSLTSERPGECAELIRRFSSEHGNGWPAIAKVPAPPPTR